MNTLRFFFLKKDRAIRIVICERVWCVYICVCVIKELDYYVLRRRTTLNIYA